VFVAARIRPDGVPQEGKVTDASPGYWKSASDATDAAGKRVGFDARS
jgi:hypothetical protein